MVFFFSLQYGIMLTTNMKNLIVNSFFQFLFNNEIFDYWNVDISTARKIGKTKAMALMMCYWLTKEEGWGGLAMRDTSSNLDNSVVSEIFWALRELDIRDADYSLGKRELTFSNGNKIYFRGAQVQNTTQITLAGFAADYPIKRWIVWLEETYQFSAKQYAEIGQAIRGAPKTIFSTSNPWLEENWYVKLMSDMQQFDKKKLIDEGHIIGSYKSDEEKRLIVYATVENTPFLSREEIAQLKNDTKAQPWQMDPVIYGMPGVLSGAIYAHLMEYVEYKMPKVGARADEYTVGIDFGEITDSTSAVLMATMDEYDEVRVLEEFEYKPSKHVNLSGGQIADLVNDVIIDWKAKYGISGNVQARYDNAAVVFGRRLKKLGPEFDIKYIPCSKKLINERIDLMTMLMAEGRMVFKDNIEILRREMKTSMWKTNKTTGAAIKERQDGNDHMLNAFEYALERRHRKLHNKYKKSIIIK